MIYLGSNRIKNMYVGSSKVKKIYHGSDLVYSAGANVTYYIDTNTSYTEEVESEASCLSPTTFTPTKSGWTFLGWREDTTASSSVLTSKVMDDEEITLYAVFYQTITLSYNGNSATSGSTSAQTGNRYYNNGNITNPTFTLRSNGFTKTLYTFSKWAHGSTSGTQYSAGASVTLSASATFYAIWTANVLRLVISAVLGETSYLFNLDGNSTYQPSIRVTFTLYTTSSGSTVYQTSNVSNNSSGSVSFCGLATATPYVLQSWDYVNEEYTDPYNLIKVTASKTLYSNTGLSSTGLASGAYITFCADENSTNYLGGTTAQYQLDAIGYSKTLTYYVSASNVS